MQCSNFVGSSSTISYPGRYSREYNSEFHPDLLARGGKMVHAINTGGAMCHAGVRSTAIARGVDII